LLQVREIRDLNLAADLVTLSACDTGVGALEGEEGIANLVRSFLFAGTRSVVASLWAASDVYTLNLMVHFYRSIADGEDKGSALRFVIKRQCGLLAASREDRTLGFLGK
jgi:CHAT domain-containing protein